MEARAVVNVYRREFLKSIPQVLLDKVQRTANILMESSFDRKSAGAATSDGIIKVAQIDVSRCMAWEGSFCQACYLACPLRDQAIRVEDQKPVVITSVCNGCGICETACRTVNDYVAVQMIVIKRGEG